MKPRHPLNHLVSGTARLLFETSICCSSFIWGFSAPPKTTIALLEKRALSCCSVGFCGFSLLLKIFELKAQCTLLNLLLEKNIIVMQKAQTLVVRSHQMNSLFFCSCCSSIIWRALWTDYIQSSGFHRDSAFCKRLQDREAILYVVHSQPEWSTGYTGMCATQTTPNVITCMLHDSCSVI